MIQRLRGGRLIGDLTYEALLEEGDEDSQWEMPEDEWQAISLKLYIGHHR